MIVLRFKDWSLSTKIASIAFVSIVVMFLSVLLYFLPTVEHRLMQEKEKTLLHLVDVSYDELAKWEARVQSGELTRDVAQKSAALSIKEFRYDKDNYFWINDMEPRMIMHPTRPDLDNTNLDDYKDPNGKRLFVEFVKVCRANGAGYVDYMWNKPGVTAQFPKLSYVIHFKPWDWIIGTGMYVDDVQVEVNRLRNIVIMGTIGVSVIILLMALFIGARISAPMKKMLAMLKDIAEGEGDLTRRLDVESADEIGQLAKWFNKFVDNLHTLILQVSRATKQISNSTMELSMTAEKMAVGAEEQTTQTSQVATAMEEMSATVREVAKHSNEASGKAKEAGEISRTGSDVVEKTVSGMNKIYESVQKLQAVISGLSQNSEKIGDIIRVIDDVADQTNLLALNAAIEAARAGEQGRGFAVVADEVRKLAERTTSSTKEVSIIVKSIQADTAQAVSSMSGSAQEVEGGTKLAQQAGEALIQILGSVRTVQEMIQQIATAAEQQSSAAEQISSNVDSISTVGKENTTAAQKTSMTSQQIQELTVRLQALVHKFRLKEDVTGSSSNADLR